MKATLVVQLFATRIQGMNSPEKRKTRQKAGFAIVILNSLRAFHVLAGAGIDLQLFAGFDE
ncbi:MAG: hypothetical protein JWQ71_4559 [Pedosphaera sp.]|nr:hypothetical protein [Pedosphaera sp.]